MHAFTENAILLMVYLQGQTAYGNVREKTNAMFNGIAVGLRTSCFLF